MSRQLWILVVVAACGGKGDGGDDGDDGSDVDAGTSVIALSGLTATVEPFICTPPGQSSRQCAAYRLTFVARNNSLEDTVRLERTRLSIGGTFVVQAPSECAREPWMIPALNMSPVLDLVFDDRGGSYDGGWPAFNVPCGYDGLTPEITDQLAPAPTQGNAELILSVRLAGGTLAEARANAALTLF